MNIIKFKDTIVADQEWYNEKLRGKYAYWVRCHYVIPLDAINPNMYVSFETTINNLLGFNYYQLKTKNDAYIYELVDDRDLALNHKKVIPLVESVPENPSENDPQFIKTQTNTIKYVDLWEGDYYWMNSYIDYTETDIANGVDVYKSYNDHVPTGSLTQDELKRFRTWLAASFEGVNYEYYKVEEGEYVKITPSLDDYLNAVEKESLPETVEEDIIKIKSLDIIDLTDVQIHMLDYYKEGMWDENIKWMDEFTKTDISIYNSSATSCACGCGSNTNISSLYSGNVTVCDPVAKYREGMKNVMVGLFGDMKTWLKMSPGYLLEIKEYIDGIVQSGFPIDNSTAIVNPYKCECLGGTLNEANASILKQLSAAFGYMAKGDLTNHKNFIAQVLLSWARDLYEYMEWK